MITLEGSPVKVQDVVERLVLLGVPRDQADAYVQLSMLGSSKASDLAATLSVSRAIAYRLLEKLEQEGLAYATFSRPMRYEAAPAQEVFERLLSKTQAMAVSIERARDDLGTVLEGLRSTEGPAQAANTFRLVQGRRELVNMLLQSTRGAQDRVDFVSTHPAAAAISETAGYWDIVRERAEAGVAFRIMMPPPERVKDGMRAALEAGAVSFRSFESPSIMRLFLRDEQELMMWVVNDTSSRAYAPGDVAIHSAAADLVRTQAEAFEALWERGATLPDAVKGGEASLL